MSQAVPRILMIAFHFPPLAGSSGIQRTLRFVQHLPANGWEPLVLTASAGAYERVSTDLASEVPAATVVRRALALDTARHLSIGGRYVGAMARPDRWVSWRFDAVRQGLQLIRQYRPQVLWSTYPIATAHLIGERLAKLSGLPWVADFRDPMAQEGYPADPLTWQHYKRIEAHAVHHAALSTFTTPGAAAEYRLRYPKAASRIRVLENGYDEDSFAGAGTTAVEPLNPGTYTLLHSGIVYPSERDPTQLMAALRLLLDSSRLVPGQLKLRFRAPVAEALLRDLAQRHGVLDFVEILPPVGYKQALSEMLSADALLVLQASNCNAQIPAKLYEYLRAGRPIVCLSDPAGDTASVLSNAGIDAIARLDSAPEIAALLARLVTPGSPAPRTLPTAAAVAEASRAGRTRTLAAWLNEMVTTPRSP
jgi:glycosyltransferase involved in cell wall biosynthesis